MNIHVRNLGRHKEGHLIAEITATDERRHTHDRHWVPVNRKWGSWTMGSREHKNQRDISRPWAAELQKQAIKYERREHSR